MEKYIRTGFETMKENPRGCWARLHLAEDQALTDQETIKYYRQILYRSMKRRMYLINLVAELNEKLDRSE